MIHVILVNRTNDFLLYFPLSLFKIRTTNRRRPEIGILKFCKRKPFPFTLMQFMLECKLLFYLLYFLTLKEFLYLLNFIGNLTSCMFFFFFCSFYLLGNTHTQEKKHNFIMFFYQILNAYSFSSFFLISFSFGMGKKRKLPVTCNRCVKIKPNDSFRKYESQWCKS